MIFEGGNSKMAAPLADPVIGGKPGHPETRERVGIEAWHEGNYQELPGTRETAQLRAQLQDGGQA